MGTVIKGLGEIALQVSDLEPMVRFYSDIVGLELIRHDATTAFFRIADGVEGHTQVLALFDRHTSAGNEPPETGPRRPPLDHLAFGISRGDYDGERSRLERLGMHVTTSVHGWVGWRSLYVNDPEGNVVEWVCYDPSVAE